MEPRLLSINEPRKTGKPLREFLVLLPNGKSFEQTAHDFAEITQETDDTTATLSLVFYVNQQRVLALPFDPEMIIMDKSHTDVAGVTAAYKKPPRKRKPKA
jgi:hypothetical protein